VILFIKEMCSGRHFEERYWSHMSYFNGIWVSY